jgi:hypothetical protein
MDPPNAEQPGTPNAPGPPKKSRTNVPAAVVTGIVCLGLGVAAGIVLAEFVTEKHKQAGAAPAPGEGDDAKGAPGGKGMGMPPGGGGGGGGGKGGGKGGKGGGPNPRTQLAQLVNKLDTLTAKPLSVQLTPDQKQQVKEQLAGLDAKDELGEEEAKAKLDALLKVVEGQKDTLVAAGYFWPGGGGGGPPGGGGGGGFGGGGPPGGPPGGGNPNANPFKTGQNADHLKSLQTTLGK